MFTFVRFGFSGLPGFALAILLNLLLVGKLGWAKPLAYLLVVWMQMTCGFLLCRYVVFTGGRAVPLVKAYAQFAGSMTVIRAADWSVYTVTVMFLDVPYLVAQVSTALLFIAIKFLLARSIFQPKSSLINQ